MTQEAKNIAADLLQRGVFSRYLECPICGSTNRIHWATSSQSNSYIATGARRIGVSEKALLDSMEGQKCVSCGALYFDPWLSSHFQRELYENLFPQHNVGWEIFWSIIKSPNHRSRDVALYNMIREKIPALDTYAEVGCPFSGLIPYLSLREYQYRSKRFLDYPGAYTLKTDVGLHPRVRGRLNFERIGSFLARFFNRVELFRVFPLRRVIKRSLIRLGRAREIGRLATDCYYIQRNSSFLWGKNCKSLGVDCSTALTNVFGTRVLGFEDLRTEKIRFDLVGIFNSLDHYKDPVGLLDQIFEFTDYIYIEGHFAQGDWGKQHLYFLQEEVLNALPKLLPLGEAIADFKGRERPHWYSILLRKRSGQQAKLEFAATV